MIAKHHDSTSTEDELQRQIKIKQSQLEIALEGDMPHVAQGLQRQLAELQAKIKSQPDSEAETLMSLVDG